MTASALSQGSAPESQNVQARCSGSAPVCTLPAVGTTTRQVWIEPIYVNVVDAQGNAHRVLVQDGQFRTIEIPAPLPPAPAPGTRFFPVQNRQRFQVQIEEVTVRRPDGTFVQVLLPEDRVIASGNALPFELPADACVVMVRFREWDWGNKRFRLPVLAFGCDLNVQPGATIL